MVTEWTAVLAGMELFSGRLTQADPAVVASAYGVNRYWVNNFDTLVRDASGSATAVLHSHTNRLWRPTAKLHYGVVRAAGREQLAHRHGGLRGSDDVVGACLFHLLLRLFGRGCAQCAGTRAWKSASPPGAHPATCPGQLAFLLESFAVKREHNTKILSVRLMRKQQGDAAAEDLQKQELDEAWYVDLERQAGAIPSRDVCCLPGRICYGTQVKTSASGRCQSFHHTATSTT